VKQAIDAVDPRWATQPTGLAFSSDTKYIAALFEQAGGGVLVTWKYPQIKTQPVTTPLPPGQLPPAPPEGERGPVNRLDPVGGGAWLVAGNVVVAVDNGATLGTLGLAAPPAGAAAAGATPLPPVTQHVYGDTVLLTHGQPKQLRATAIKFDRAKLRPAAPPK
jgi:hypothetical protein